VTAASRKCFKGALAGGTIAGSWQDFPFGAGDSGELSVDPAKLTLTPTLSGSLGDIGPVPRCAVGGRAKATTAIYMPAAIMI
jgi:hypothetical protein